MTIPVSPNDLPPSIHRGAIKPTSPTVGTAAQPACVWKSTWILGTALELNLWVTFCLLLCRRWCNFENTAGMTRNYQICLRRISGLRVASLF